MLEFQPCIVPRRGGSNLREMFKCGWLITVLCFFHRNVAVAPAAPIATPGFQLPDVNNSTLLANSFANSIMNSLSRTISNTMKRIADPVMKEMLVTVSREFTRFALRLEFFTIAAGSHLAVPEPAGNVDMKYHKIAAATVELWLRLNTMERVEEILTNATSEALKSANDVMSDPKYSETDKMRTTLKFVFERVDAMLREDQELHPKYLGIRKRVMKSFSLSGHKMYIKQKPKSTEEENKVFEEWFSIPKIKKLLVNKMFLMQCMKRFTSNSSRDEYERYVLGRALVALSKEATKRKRVQTGYYKAVRKTAAKLMPYVENERVYSGFLGELSKYANDIVITLFSKLEKHFKKDTVIKADLKAMKQRVRASDDWHAYHIDYWPL